MTLIKSYEINSIADFKEVDFKLSLIFTVDPIDIVLLKNVKAVYNKEEVTTYMEKVKRRKENDTVTDINEDKDLSPVVKSEEK